MASSAFFSKSSMSFAILNSITMAIPRLETDLINKSLLPVPPYLLDLTIYPFILERTPAKNP